jgi:hypothetical protein
MFEDARNAAAAAREKAEAAAAAAREKAEAAAAAAREKAEAAAAAAAAEAKKAAEAAAATAAGLMENGKEAMSDLSNRNAFITVGAALVTLITNIIKAVVPLIAMVYILSTIARNPGGMTGITKTARDTLKEKLADLKNGMAEFVKGRPELESCITTFETNIQNAKLNPPSPPPPQSNVGKTCIYSPGIATTKGTQRYQALIVEEWDQAKAEENGYGQPMFLIWVNGGGLSADIVMTDKVKIVPETDKEFTDLAGIHIGQQRVTMEQARAHYELPPPQNTSVAVEPLEQQETPFDILKQRAEEFSQAPDKKQFIVDVVNGYIAASKLRLERVMGRVQDPVLRRCIQSIKEALTQQIKSQVAELKGKLSEISNSEEIQEVFEQITALGQGLRDRATELFGSLRSPFGRRE